MALLPTVTIRYHHQQFDGVVEAFRHGQRCVMTDEPNAYVNALMRRTDADRDDFNVGEIDVCAGSFEKDLGTWRMQRRLWSTKTTHLSLSLVDIRGMLSCESGWIGTIKRRSGIWDLKRRHSELWFWGVVPLLCWLLINARAFGSSMRFLLACAWTFTWTTPSKCMSCLSSLPLTSGAIFVLLPILIVNTIKAMISRRRLQLKSHLSQCQSPI
eukprot:s2794_g4.t1